MQCTKYRQLVFLVFIAYDFICPAQGLHVVRREQRKDQHANQAHNCAERATHNRRPYKGCEANQNQTDHSRG